MFAYIGMSTFGITGQKLNVIFVALSFLFCLVGRALNTFPLSAGLNMMRKRKVPFATQFVIWFSGLRGAIAFALSLEIETENKNVLKTTTLAIVLLTTFLIGGGTLPLLEFLKIVGPRSVKLPLEVIQEKEALTHSKMWFLRVDREILTPFFCKKDQIPEDRQSQNPKGKSADDIELSATATVADAENPKGADDSPAGAESGATDDSSE